MNDRPVLSALIDVSVSVAAIALVLVACVASTRISGDFRAIFALTCCSFFLAGVARGGSIARRVPWLASRLSAGGLLGIAALILNNGPHRLSILATLLIGAYVSAFAGVIVRRTTHDHLRQSLAAAATWLLFAISATVLFIPKLSAYAAFDRPRTLAIPFTLAVNDQTVSSAALRGRVVVLAFWASWCADCYLELPHVAEVYREFSNEPRVTFYLVDTGWEGETAEAGRKALARHHIEAPMAFDSGEAAKSFDVDAIPAIVLIDALGKVRSVHRGYDSSEDMEENLRSRIRELLDQ